MCIFYIKKKMPSKNIFDDYVPEASESHNCVVSRFDKFITFLIFPLRRKSA